MAQERVDSEGGKGGNKKAIRQQKKKDDKADGGGGGEKGRVVAVDWAVGKDEFKRAQLDGEPKATVEASGSENDSDEDSEEEDDEEEKDDDSDMSPVPEGAEEEEEERHADDDDDELEEEPQGPEPAKGTTLFVRNMSFEATESELYDLQVARYNFVLLVSLIVHSKKK
jgi:nucleolar protein 4